MDIDDWVKWLVYGVLGIAALGVLLGISVDWLIGAFVSWMGSLLIGIVCGTIAAAIAGLLTRDLPPALLAGGTTTAVVTIVIRIILWLKVHLA